MKDIHKPRQPEPIEFIIPRCCTEGWDTCPHVVNRDKIKKSRTNIGL